MERETSRSFMGVSYSLQNPHRYDTLPVGIWEDMPSTRRIGRQITLGIKKWHMDLPAARIKRQMQLGELEEWREKSYHNARMYKEKTKRWHDKRIKKKSFKPGDMVLLFNSRFKLFGHGKLRSKWDDPFTVLNSASHGAVTLQDSDGNTFKVNGQRLKIFLEPNMPNLEEFDVIEVINLD
jgi:hypothetical protein